MNDSEITSAFHRAPASGDREVAGNSSLVADASRCGRITPELTLRARLEAIGSAHAQPLSTRRAGLSLMEVILAMTVLSITLGMLYSVATRGSRSGAKARDLTKAQLLCESKLAEISAGIEPAMVVSGVVSEVDGEWLYSVDLEATDLEGIVAIRVSFVQNLPAKKQPIEFSLVRWIRDPDAELSEQTE